MEEGRIATSAADGGYRKCIEAKLTWPTADKYIAVSGRRLLVGDYRQDYPWVFSAQRQGTAPGRFQNPAMATQDAEGRIYVADRGNGRIQVFRADRHDEPERIIKTAGGPVAVDVRGARWPSSRTATGCCCSMERRKRPAGRLARRRPRRTLRGSRPRVDVLRGVPRRTGPLRFAQVPAPGGRVG